RDFTNLAGTLLRNYNINSYPVQPSSDVYTQFVSGTNDTMLVILDFKTTGPDPKNSIASIRTDVQHANVFSNTNLLVYVTGAPAFNYDIETESIRDVERIDPITVVLIIVIVGLFFASVAAPLIPVSAIGISVGIAFGSLAIAGFGMLRSIGIAVMIGISIALLVALTLVPAILSMFGDKIFWPGGLGLWRKKRVKGSSYYARAAKFTAKHSKLILIVALAVSLPATSTVLSSQTSHDLISQGPTSLESR